MVHWSIITVCSGEMWRHCWAVPVWEPFLCPRGRACSLHGGDPSDHSSAGDIGWGQ